VTEEGLQRRLLRVHPLLRLYLMEEPAVDQRRDGCPLGEQQVQQGAQPKGIGPWKRMIYFGRLLKSTMEKTGKK